MEAKINPKYVAEVLKRMSKDNFAMMRFLDLLKEVANCKSVDCLAIQKLKEIVHELNIENTKQEEKEQKEEVVEIRITANPKIGHGWVAEIDKNGNMHFLKSLQYSGTHFYLIPQPTKLYLVCQDNSSHKHRKRIFQLVRFENGEMVPIATIDEFEQTAVIEGKEYNTKELLGLLAKWGCIDVPKGKNRYVLFLQKYAKKIYEG